jgi:Na+-transporting NADH:ubiquinone oxidoreductase subunit NqrB
MHKVVRRKREDCIVQVLCGQVIHEFIFMVIPSQSPFRHLGPYAYYLITALLTVGLRLDILGMVDAQLVHRRK